MKMSEPDKARLFKGIQKKHRGGEIPDELFPRCGKTLAYREQEMM